MNDNNRVEFQEVWTATYAMYRQRVSDSMLDLAFGALAPYSIEDVRKGITAHIRNPDTGHFPPKPADVIKHVSGNSQSAGGEAWAKVDRAIRCVGNYRSVVFDDPRIHAAIERLGGWQKVSLTEEKEYQFLRNSFLKLFQGFTIQPPEAYPRKLIGTCEHENSTRDSFRRGRPNDEPVMIGNPERARLVYQGGGELGIAQISQSGTQQYLESAIDSTIQRIGKSA
ncbi:DUF6475 domain-containing protein [Marinobacter sp.]|uniref:DUF6475 domain-containing protein n=1 Tax=Marinobacter sp. TaxID=50741 RepID=UPI003A903568